MMDKIEKFKNSVLSSGIIDKKGTHHVFSQGLHGRKIDFDLIPDGSDLFRQWVEVTCDFIRDNYSPVPGAIIGVANGTNRLALAVAESLGGDVKGLVTVKPEGSRNQPVLTEESEKILRESRPESIVILEDVGTRGTNSSSVAKSVRELDLAAPEVINTWQRSDTLKLLDEAEVPYKALIKEMLISYTSEECREKGYCSEGWEILDHGKTK
jgi:orotate phosphoribosyltransferase-like protein